MRILLCHTKDLHPATAERMQDVPGVEMVDVTGDDFGYWKAVRERWTGESDLLLIEQDIVIHDQVIPQLENCPGDWCVFPYTIFNSQHRLTQGLGCTRFSAALQRRINPDGFDTDGRLVNLRDSETGIPWGFLDVIIADRLRLAAGLSPHIHEPDVDHRHDYSGPIILGSSFRDPEGHQVTVSRPASPYDKTLPVLLDTRPKPPAIQVYGVTPSKVDSPEDAARLANALTARYLNSDGTPRYSPAPIDMECPRALRFCTDKVPQGYLPVYLRLASEIGMSGRVCEIGVWQGESLRMWQALFPGGIVAGVDSDSEARWPQESVRIVAGQDDDALPGRLAGISPAGWDLIVDDASHDGLLSRRTWELLWPLVVPGGYYVVEDWFVCFPPLAERSYGTSMRDTAQSFLDLLDTRNGELESAEYRYGMIILRKRD
jgi:hypothetical protein